MGRRTLAHEDRGRPRHPLLPMLQTRVLCAYLSAWLDRTSRAGRVFGRGRRHGSSFWVGRWKGGVNRKEIWLLVGLQEGVMEATSQPASHSWGTHR